MPIYEYECRTCHHNFEKLMFLGDEEKVTCPKCKGEDVKKLMSCARVVGGGLAAACTSGGGKGFS